MKAIAALVFTLAVCAAPVQQAAAAQGDRMLDFMVQAYQPHLVRGAWVNAHLPGDPSADQRMAEIAAGYRREVLDRGGWRNPHAPASHYAAGEPLQAARIGGGVTTGRGDAPGEALRVAAAR